MRFRKAVKDIAWEAVDTVLEHGAGHPREEFEDERLELARRFQVKYGSGRWLGFQCGPLLHRRVRHGRGPRRQGHAAPRHPGRIVRRRLVAAFIAWLRSRRCHRVVDHLDLRCRVS